MLGWLIMEELPDSWVEVEMGALAATVGFLDCRAR
jgi:hypothetical protein